MENIIKDPINWAVEQRDKYWINKINKVINNFKPECSRCRYDKDGVGCWNTPKQHYEELKQELKEKLVS